MIRAADTSLRVAWSARFAVLPLDSRLALAGALADLRRDALARAEHCWRRHKAPMALYWKVVGVYSGHLARVIARLNLAEASHPAAGVAVIDGGVALRPPTAETLRPQPRKASAQDGGSWPADAAALVLTASEAGAAGAEQTA